jgi:TrmH family RNA methyltransferase
MSGILSSGDVIASNSNLGIKLIRSLRRRKIRQQERAFVVEGIRAVGDVIHAGQIPQAVYIRDDFDPELVRDLPDNIPLRRVIAPVFDALTDVPHPQGILAIVPMPDESSLPEASGARTPLLLIVDAVRDPGNLGTLLRSAAGAGADHVVIAPETVDPYHPRAVRAAMGAHVRVPLSHWKWDELATSLGQYDMVALADASGEAEYDRVSWLMPTALIVGGEAFGPTAPARRCATTRVAIPLAGGVESLNAGVAGSLLLFEAARQRRVNRALE